MAYIPDLSFFIKFHELDPSEQKRCIFFNLKGTRCKYRCDPSNNKRAVELFHEIIALRAESVSLDQLQEYALCNCCTRAPAYHQHRIVDRELLLRLAQRWHDEIIRHAAEQSNDTTSVSTSEEDTIPATPTSIRTTLANIPTSVTSYHQCDVSAPFGNSATPLDSSTTVLASSTSPLIPSMGSWSLQSSSPGSANTTASMSQPSESQPSYGVCTRGANLSTTSTSRAPLSEFRHHIARPGPRDTISHKIRDQLKNRDFERGLLYIFDRITSPGHVKIGWTTEPTVQIRLNGWKTTCGYTPNLLFSTPLIPHAQRVEKLTHYELIKEWRRERRCKALRCGRSHQEWFEVSKEKAEQVLRDWADFMTRAEPYSFDGFLKDMWRELLDSIDKDGEEITAAALLEYYEATLVEDEVTLVEDEVTLVEDEVTLVKEEATLVEDFANIGLTPKVDEEVDSERPVEVKGLKGTDNASVCVGLSQIHQPLQKGVLPSNGALVNQEVPPKRMPLPLSPLIQPITPSQDMKLLGPENGLRGCDVDTDREEAKPNDQDESTGAGAKCGDAEVTLVEETEALQIVNELCATLFSSKAVMLSKDSVEVEALEKSAPPTVPVIAQA